MLLAQQRSSNKNQCVENAVFRFADLLFVTIWLDALVIFVCIFYGLRAALRVRVENLQFEENAIKAGAPKIVCFDFQSSVIISSVGITRENFSIEQLKYWLDLDIVANLIHQVCKHVSEFVGSYSRLWRNVGHG